jgi:hypothetical protein
MDGPLDLSLLDASDKARLDARQYRRIAEIIPAEDQHDYTGKHGERPNPAETDPSKIALALLTLLHAPQPGGK